VSPAVTVMETGTIVRARAAARVAMPPSNSAKSEYKNGPGISGAVFCWVLLGRGAR